MSGTANKLENDGPVYFDSKILTQSYFIDPKLPAEILLQLELLKIKEEELSLLKYLNPLVSNHLDIIIHNFLETLENDPLYSEEKRKRIKDVLAWYILQLFEGRLDIQLINSRENFAYILLNSGLKVDWYVVAIQNTLKLLLDMLKSTVMREEELKEITKAITKLFSFELQLIMKSYRKLYDSYLL